MISEIFDKNGYLCLKPTLEAMKRALLLLLLLSAPLAWGQEHFPDGTPIDAWFCRSLPEVTIPQGERFVVTDHGVAEDSTRLQTAALQRVIDLAAEQGGVVVIPRGTFLSGALFFPQGTSLHLEEGAVLKGSDDIADFPILPTRIEGQSLDYFAALVNADGVKGFSITGRGAIDGNGLRYWRSFWLRRRVNPRCTNMDEMRPRLLYISNAEEVLIEGVTLRNSPFWTCHLYRSERVRIRGVHFFAPAEPVRAPSTDAIDIDACCDVHISDCYLSVNDDAIALKGGKGPWADQQPENGANERILIEDCTFGYCHSALTCGSESIHNRNVLMRRCRVEEADRLLWLKMRPDTPQNYEYITLEDISGSARALLYIHPWTQFFDLKGREDIPMSYASHLTLQRIGFRCDRFFDVATDESQYHLSDFLFRDLKVEAADPSCDRQVVERFRWKGVELTAGE